MIRQDRNSSRLASGLRTKYRPKSRIGQGLVSVAPWVDLVLLVLCFLIFNDMDALQPSIRVDLPEAPFEQGSRPGLVAVVMCVTPTDRGPGKEIVFFDDERFVVREEGSMRSLNDSIAECAEEQRDATLVIQADRNVKHGTVVDIMNMALESGIKRVNVATKSVE
jgi:biopolymer transport protein ExbD